MTSSGSTRIATATGEDAPFVLNLVWEAAITSGELEPADDVSELRWFPKDALPADDEVAFRWLAPALRELGAETP